MDFLRQTLFWSVACIFGIVAVIGIFIAVAMAGVVLVAAVALGLLAVAVAVAACVPIACWCALFETAQVKKVVTSVMARN